jgi:hypothetical protein
MVPWTAYCVADNQAVDQRPVIVGAVGIEREHCIGAADQEDLVLADMTGQHAAVAQIR